MVEMRRTFDSVQLISSALSELSRLTNNHNSCDTNGTRQSIREFYLSEAQDAAIVYTRFLQISPKS